MIFMIYTYCHAIYDYTHIVAGVYFSSLGPWTARGTSASGIGSNLVALE